MTCLLQQTCGALGPCLGSPRPFFHFYVMFYVGIVHLHCCLSFRCIAKSIFYTHTYIHSFLDSFPIQIITEFSVLYSSFLLVIFLIFYIQQYVCVSPSLPMYPFPPLSPGNNVYFLYLLLYFCFVDKFICRFLLYSICKQYHILFFSYFTQFENLQVQPCCCKWHYFALFNGRVTFHCMYGTTSSLSIALLTGLQVASVSWLL